MRVALTGTHGVGKTTVFDRVRLRRPDAAFFSEAVRHQMVAFDLGHPIDDVCRKYGIGAFELFNMNAWSVIDSSVNTELGADRLVITDRSTIDSFAYFLAMQGTVFDSLLEPLVRKIAQYYASLYDLFIYFPHDVFPLVGDDIRPASIEFQRKVDACLWRAFGLFETPEKKIHRLQATNADARAEEVLALLPVP